MKFLFDVFLKKMAVELSKSHFRLISSGSYDHLAVYTKSEMPIMYIVSVIDFDNVDMDKYQNVIFFSPAP